MIRDILAACSTVGAILAWWLIVFLLSGCAALMVTSYAVNGAIGLVQIIQLLPKEQPPMLSAERPDESP